MSKNTLSVCSRKVSFCALVLFMVLSFLLYLYTSNNNILQPFVNVANEKFRGASGKMFNDLEISNYRSSNTRDDSSKVLDYGSNKSDISEATYTSKFIVMPKEVTKEEVNDQAILEKENRTRVNLAFNDGSESLIRNLSSDREQLSSSSTTTTILTKSSYDEMLHQTIGRITSQPFLTIINDSQSRLNQSLFLTQSRTVKPLPLNSKENNAVSIHSTIHPQDPHSNFQVDCSRLWVTSHQAGRLGNIMCEYAHLMVLHHEHGVQVGLLPAMHKSLSPNFPSLSIKLLPDVCLKDKDMKTYGWTKIDKLLRDGKLSMPSSSGGYPCNATRLWKYRDIWRREFSFTTSARKRAELNQEESVKKWKIRRIASGKVNLKVTKPTTKLQMLGEANSTKIPDPIVIGVHVRRTDYIIYVQRVTGGTVVGEKYFQKTFQYFREKYENIVFLVASDDRKWCREILEKKMTDVVVAPPGSPLEDMALLAASSHLIMSLGTYGFWAGVLSKGVIAYPKKLGKSREYFMTQNLNRLNSSELIPIL